MNGLSGLTGHTDRSAVTLDNRFGDRQSQSAAGAFRRACGVDFVEPLEYVRQMLRCDAGARVADRQRGDAVGLRRAQRDRSARRRMPKRIATRFSIACSMRSGSATTWSACAST